MKRFQPGPERESFPMDRKPARQSASQRGNHQLQQIRRHPRKLPRMLCRHLMRFERLQSVDHRTERVVRHVRRRYRMTSRPGRRDRLARRLPCRGMGCHRGLLRLAHRHFTPGPSPGDRKRRPRPRIRRRLLENRQHPLRTVRRPCRKPPVVLLGKRTAPMGSDKSPVPHVGSRLREPLAAGKLNSGKRPGRKPPAGLKAHSKEFQGVPMECPWAFRPHQARDLREVASRRDHPPENLP